MVSESQPPLPSSGGNLKYTLLGLVLFALALALFFGMNCGTRTDEAAGPVSDAVAPIKRSTALAAPTIEIPDLVPDTGPPEPVRTKIRYRYVRDRWDCESGQIPARAASQVVNGYRRQIRNCYERRLKQNNNLEGRVNLQVRVGARGTVTGVRVGGSLRDPQVFSCVRRIANSWRFPAPTGGNCAVLAQTFNMTPRR